jgi:hypothetical protein
MLDGNTVIEEGCNDWVPMQKVEARRVVYLLDIVSQISQKAGIMQTECDAPLAVQYSVSEGHANPSQPNHWSPPSNATPRANRIIQYYRSKVLGVCCRIWE